MYFTLERNFEFRDCDVRDGCVCPTDIKTELCTCSLTRLDFLPEKEVTYVPTSRKTIRR
jgi:hypothetical protein